jgi:hypothetical protein
LGSWAKIFRERFHGRRKAIGSGLLSRAVHCVESPELDFAVSRKDDLFLVAACDYVREKIIGRVDQEMLGNIIAIRSPLERLSRGEDAKIRRRKYSQELLARIRSSHCKNSVWRLPKRERGFVSNEEPGRRRDDRSTRRGLRHEIPFRDNFAFPVLLPRRIKRGAHHPDVGLRTVLRGNFRAFAEDAQVLLAKHGPIGQTNFQGTERTIAGIFEFIGDVKVDPAGGRAGNENLRLPIGKLISGAKGVDAGRREKRPSAQGNGK